MYKVYKSKSRILKYDSSFDNYIDAVDYANYLASLGFNVSIEAE